MEAVDCYRTRLSDFWCRFLVPAAHRRRQASLNRRFVVLPCTCGRTDVLEFGVSTLFPLHEQRRRFSDSRFCFFMILKEDPALRTIWKPFCSGQVQSRVTYYHCLCQLSEEYPHLS